jgi:hypothetical protein
MRIILTLLALLALVACEQAGTYSGMSAAAAVPAQHLLTTQAQRYTTSALVTVRLTNRTGRALGYNLCNSRLERLDSEGDWRPAQQGLAEVCTQELRTLRPGQGVTYSFTPRHPTRAGEYRVVTSLDDLRGGSRFESVSNNFTLVRNGD